MWLDDCFVFVGIYNIRFRLEINLLTPGAECLMKMRFAGLQPKYFTLENEIFQHN